MSGRTAPIDALLLELERTSGDARADVVATLAEHAYDDEKTRPHLTSVLPGVLGDEHDLVRRAGLELAAHTLAPEEAQPLFIEALRDRSSFVRLEAAGRLADQGRADVRAPLAAALQDDVFEVRFEAARGMATLKHAAGFDVLVQALESVRLRYRALGALAELGDARALAPVRATFKKWFLSGFERTQAAGALVRLGDPEGASYLLKRTRSRWANDRAQAIEMCGEVRVPGSLERLSEIARTPKDVTRGAAARGLGRLGDPAAAPLLWELIRETGNDDELRLDAADGLMRMQWQDPAVRDALRELVPSLRTHEAREELKEMLAQVETDNETEGGRA